MTQSLCKRFGEKDVLKDVNLHVRSGEVFVLIGPTGIGKTTLLRLLALLEPPTSGKILFDGRDTDAPEGVRLAMRRRMAVVLQKPTVFNATVYDNVAYGLKVRGRRAADLRHRVASALDTVGLSGYEGRNARTLSGGEAQRVALARAMVLEPEVLLLDEPTANLDPVAAANVERLLASVIAELRTTVIMTTHDMSQGQRLADRVGVLMEGRLVQTGTPGEVFGGPQSREIAQFVGMENILAGTIVANEGGMVTVDIGGPVLSAVSHLGPPEKVHACIRAEDVALSLSPAATSARNTFRGQITAVSFAGPLARVDLDCGFPLTTLVTRRSAEEMGLEKGKEVHASFKATGVHIVPPGT